MSGPALVFLLSPASLAGIRGRALLEGRSSAPFLPRLRTGEGVPVAQVFTFLSSLYFRGKEAYARAFARPPEGVEGAWVITSSSGLVPLDADVTLADLEAFSRVDIDAGEDGYRLPLLASARALAGRLHPPGDGACRVVLLGSIASGKYFGPLLEVFGPRLHVPSDFVGRGDMSRGGLMLRAVDAGTELQYVRAEAAPRRGPRPPRLAPRKRGARG